jgi:hypothetical protein
MRYAIPVLAGLAIFCSGCVHHSHHHIIPDTPDNKTSIIIAVICNFEDEESFGHDYVIPNQLTFMRDESGNPIHRDEFEERIISKSDLMSVYQQVSRYISSYKTINVKPDSKSAILEVGYSDEQNSIFLSRPIQIPYDSNPTEIRELISMCQQIEKDNRP